MFQNLIKLKVKKNIHLQVKAKLHMLKLTEVKKTTLKTQMFRLQIGLQELIL